MKEHIHTWNHYNEENKLCCSTCDLTHNKYLVEKVQDTKKTNKGN